MSTFQISFCKYWLKQYGSCYPCLAPMEGGCCWMWMLTWRKIICKNKFTSKYIVQINCMKHPGRSKFIHDRKSVYCSLISTGQANGFLCILIVSPHYDIRNICQSKEKYYFSVCFVELLNHFNNHCQIGIWNE